MLFVVINMRNRLIIIDDDEKYADNLKNIFSSKYEVTTASDFQSGKDALSNEFDIALIDIRLNEDDEDNVDGTKLIKDARTNNPGSVIIMMTAYPNLNLAIDCFRLGADDFIQKSKTQVEIFPVIIQKIIEKKKLQVQVNHLKATLDVIHPNIIIGNDPKILEIEKLIKFVAKEGNVNVLITGETGVGKELVATNIHLQGIRNKEPFIIVPLASLHTETINSALFGHSKGAYTGAVEKRTGYIESADKGILFLDEIGELNLDVQSKLLRVIELKEFTPLGKTKPQKVDIQIIAATNRNLQDLVKAGTFREDLFYRLNVFEINVPPLRERREDIPLLVDYYSKHLCRKFKLKSIKISNEVKNVFKNFNWNGNIRQVFNVLENSVMMMKLKGDEIITIEHLPEYILKEDRRDSDRELRDVTIYEYLAEKELQIVSEKLDDVNWKKTELHRVLGLNDRFAVRRRLRKIFERFPQFKEEYKKLYKFYFKKKMER
jgi:DNA-binding NtrC family response regulator